MLFRSRRHCPALRVNLRRAKKISSSRRRSHRSWCRHQRRRRCLYLCRNSNARLPLPKVEEVLVKAIAVGVTTTSLAAISQQPRCRTPIPARCSQIRAGQALWKNSSKDWWKLRLLISRKGRLIAAVSRLWLTECIWKCDREPLRKACSRSHYFIVKNL